MSETEDEGLEVVNVVTDRFIEGMVAARSKAESRRLTINAGHAASAGLRVSC